jgi:steroid delta-isomerase-like uncharacterized protein
LDTSQSTAAGAAAVQRYFEAWNRHDPDAILATFAEGGSYSDPASGGRLSGRAIADYAARLFEAIPDVAFELLSVVSAADDLVAAQWLMRGTNTGPFHGGPPTRGTVALPGADFIRLEDGNVRSVEGYFDQKTYVEQLGLQALIQPRQLGPVTFGYSTRLDLGKRTKPGAFSLTVIELNSEEEFVELGRFGRAIQQAMVGMDGVIGSTTFGVGKRGYTITAWENAEQPRQMLDQRPHREAMRAFYGTEFAAGGWTSVWVPERRNTMWVRCMNCHAVVDAEASGGTCGCGAVLPNAPAFW